MDGLSILLVLSVLPSVILGIYIYKKDKVEKEPFGYLAKLFGFGVLSTFVAMIVESIAAELLELFGISQTGSIISIFLYVLIGIAAIEEGVKWGIFKLFAWKSEHFSHLYDAIVYSVFISLGFATFENILYVLSNGLGVALLRAVLSVPGHAFFGVFMGYYLGLSKKQEVDGAKKTDLAWSYIIPVLLHTIFDFLLFCGSGIALIIYIIFIICLYIFAFVTVHKKSKTDQGLGITNNNNYIPTFNYQYCPNCGSKVNSDLCMSCGCLVKGNYQPKYCGNCGNSVNGDICMNCGCKVK